MPRELGNVLITVNFSHATLRHCGGVKQEGEGDALPHDDTDEAETCLVRTRPHLPPLSSGRGAELTAEAGR